MKNTVDGANLKILRYPNPTSGIVNITNILFKTTVYVMNLMGVNMITIPNVEYNCKIDMSKLSKGFYIIQNNYMDYQ
jgi:hypothetical protein